MKIYKYKLEIVDNQKIVVPINSTILSVANQNGSLCLWVMVDLSNPNKTERYIEIIGTGNPIPDNQRRFIGTVIIDSFVWHVFENDRNYYNNYGLQ